MKWNTIKYLCKEGFVGLWKNRLMALASAGTIVLCLLIFGMSYAIAENIEYMLYQVETQLGITAYVADDTPKERLAAIGNEMLRTEHVTEVTYISKEDALQTFAADQGNDELFNQFQNDNPLPASYEIKVDSVENQEKVVATLSKIPELQVDFFKQETRLFMEINKSIQLISFIVTSCLVVIALLLITNTIKLTVYVRRKEINIMKYLGATDAFIRLPFVIEGVLIGVIGCLVPSLVLKQGYNWMIELMGQSLGTFMGGIHFIPLSEIMGGLLPIFIALAVGMGALGSGIAIHKHLKV